VKHSPLLPFALLLLAAPLSSQTEVAKLIPSDPSSFAAFGTSVAVSGDVAIVGAPDKAVNGLNFAGAAYVFRRAAGVWTQEAELNAPVPELHDDFGTSVAIQGNLALVGAPDFPVSAFTGPGTVYLFRFDGVSWNLDTILNAADAAADAVFGRSVALDGNRILVGAQLARSGGVAFAGAAYAFHFDGTAWVQDAKFTDAVPLAWEGFGSKVSLQGDTGLVSVPAAPVGIHNGAGEVHVYRDVAGTWSQEAVLQSNFPDDFEGFGNAVSIDGDLALIGMPADTINGITNVGSAFLFRRTGTVWALEKKLEPQTIVSNLAFGGSVSLSGNLALVSIAGDNSVPNPRGGAQAFRFDGVHWVREPEFSPSDPGAPHAFGRSLSLDGSTALVGDPSQASGFPGDGSAYVFDLAPPFLLAFSPDPLESGNKATLSVTHGTPGAATFLAYSLKGPGSTFVPFLQVTLDLKKPVQAGSKHFADAAGAASWLLKIPASALGKTVWLQAAQFGKVTNRVQSTIQ